jgi:hypothetical protein
VIHPAFYTHIVNLARQDFSQDGVVNTRKELAQVARQIAPFFKAAAA